MARWLGLRSAPERLGGDVVVLSPHLDDGIFSLGAAISRAARSGARVTVLTVLAGDPGSEAPAGDWDGSAGFLTAGEAARGRREEDRRACGLVGARPVWLPYSDRQYERGADDETIREAVIQAVGGATALVPAFPLMHPDHAWLARLLEGCFERDRLGYYVEQPYAALWTSRPGVGPQSHAYAPMHREGWQPLPAALPDRLRKIRACRAYTSQLPLLDERMVSRICRYEARNGGEAVAWAREAP